MSIEVGSKLQGKVTGITKFGAFVELPEGVTGLVHISEVADNYVKDINDHLKVGDTVYVKVINVGQDGKIGLSIRKAKDTPSSQRPRRAAHDRSAADSLEQKISRFLKESEDRLASLRRHTESKRGGRGSRRG
ncbi:S1 domain-containing RNA-binding protein [Geobacillus stearothermophilus]|uniref:S1 domain-containing RNA-binding protein n=1 Tax=Geobacillus stearothermophilus TaxID=1422 RepID=UPI002E1D5606|nr:S1 domain-containing RNA-binding protein [Geobacillus stearothermophilus]MED3747552.1 S1 domain-containing RNA-binding protein [Geobacillus stearothermophilus]MED3752206.1 S1 domain-containing RNA-binding protein [Geobacillus stearothermophilus]